MIPPHDQLPLPPPVPGLPILRVIAGSHAYGMDTPESDIDIRGIFVPDREYVLGTRRVEQVEGKPDTVMYALQKYIALARNANPNILEMLFTPTDCILEIHPIGLWLAEQRSLFLSRKVRWTFCGYAAAQIHRLEVHRNHLMNPPKSKPERTDFGLPPGEKLISREQMGAFYVALGHIMADVVETMPEPELHDLQQTVKKIVTSEAFPGWEGLIQSRGIPVAAMESVQKLTGASDNFIRVLQQEQAYYRAVDAWNKYQTWLRQRNPARAELEAKYGFDLKYAMHAVRLVRQGEEIMRTGELVVRLPDAAALRGIRHGIWLDETPITYEKVKEFVIRKETEMQALYDSKDCPLPKAPDAEALDRLCMAMFESAWYARVRRMTEPED